MTFKYHIALQGPSTRGARASAYLLKTLVDVLTDGTRGALRLRVEGRSSAPGSDPSWLKRASDFDILRLAEGSTVIDIEAPSLASVVPEQFAQQDLFRNFSTDSSAFDLFEESFADAISEQKESDLYDEGLLQTYEQLNDVFDSGINTLSISGASSRVPTIIATKESIERVKRLQRETPPPQAARIAGRLNTIRHSDKMFELTLQNGESLRGVAPVDCYREQLTDWFGKNVIVSGKAVFRPSGSILRIEASRIDTASGNVSLWSASPKAQKEPMKARQLYKPQGPRSGLNILWARWPGTETDEEIQQALNKP